MRNSGSVAIWLFVSMPVASVANALMAGGKPMNSEQPTTPINPVTAASGTWLSIRIHMHANAMPTALPGLSCAHADMPAKSNNATRECDNDDCKQNGDRGRHGIGLHAAIGTYAIACLTLLMAITACTSALTVSSSTTTKINGAIGKPSSTVVRDWL